MVNFNGGVRAAALALALVIGFAGSALADDFLTECKTGVGDAAIADKVCSCMSGKITAADRPTVIDAMKKSNVATAKGGQVDPATMTPQVVKGIEVAMSAQLQCM
jgi:ribosome maturation protein Sdo1